MGDLKSGAGTPCLFSPALHYRASPGPLPARGYLCPLPSPADFSSGGKPALTPPYRALPSSGRGGSLRLRAAPCPCGGGGGFPGPTPLGIPLTHRARGGDDSSFRQDLHDARPHRGRAAAVGIQVAQELLDNQVGVLRLGGRERCWSPDSSPHMASEPGQPLTRTQSWVDKREVPRLAGARGGTRVPRFLFLSPSPSSVQQGAESNPNEDLDFHIFPGPLHFKWVKSQF